MSQSNKKVLLRWLKRRGKHLLPYGNDFVATMLINGEEVIIPSWCVRVVVTQTLNQKYCTAEITHTANQAPSHLLTSGNTFLIYDGPNPIAKGEVL